MKKTYYLGLFVLSAVLFTSCSLFKKDGENSISGKTDIPINTAGNTITPGTVTVGSTSVPVDASLTVLKNEKGEITAKVEISTDNLKQFPGYQAIEAAIPDRYKDSSGNISTELKFKSTDEGILDYANMDGEPHTLVKYADPVGTTYSITKSDGRTLTREVVAKSTTDDFPYGFMYIKTSTVKMDLNSGGVRSVTYRANHKFGIVHMEATMDDGSKVSSYMYSENS